MHATPVEHVSWGCRKSSRHAPLEHAKAGSIECLAIQTNHARPVHRRRSFPCCVPLSIRSLFIGHTLKAPEDPRDTVRLRVDAQMRSSLVLELRDEAEGDVLVLEAHHLGQPVGYEGGAGFNAERESLESGVKVCNGVGERQQNAVGGRQVDMGRVKRQVGGRFEVDEGLRLPVEVRGLLSVRFVRQRAVGCCRDVPFDGLAARTFRDLGERMEGRELPLCDQVQLDTNRLEIGGRKDVNDWFAT
jgi:hypothetical protein